MASDSLVVFSATDARMYGRTTSGRTLIPFRKRTPNEYIAERDNRKKVEELLPAFILDML